ncbi:MAG: ABC transporter ATP-binding protein [Planctomycetota bacterium]
MFHAPETSPDASAVETSGLTRRFGKFTAVDHVTFRVRRGEIFGLLGPNGAGKSTILRMLCGLLAPTEGAAVVAGADIARDPDGVRRNIGYMSQKFSLYRDLSVAENIAFFGGVYGLSKTRLAERAAWMTAMTGLAGFEHRLTGTLSGAVQQRLALGCAVLHEPDVLFLDEPTSGVDPLSRREFWALIRGMALRGVTVMVTTHFMDEAELCDRICFIGAGKLMALDTPAALKGNASDGNLFEVTPAAIRGSKEAAGTVPGVVSVSWFGNRLHILCRNGAHSSESLAAELARRGNAPRNIRTAPPTLEDAFLRLARGEPS